MTPADVPASTVPFFVTMMPKISKQIFTCVTRARDHYYRNSFFNRSPPWRSRPDCLRSLFKIRIVPSLATLKLVQGSHPGYHSQTGALIVADPEIGELIYKPRKAQKHNAIAVCKEAGSRDDCKTSWPNTFDWRSRDKVCCTSTKLTVLSCCHSACGQIRTERVIGIASSVLRIRSSHGVSGTLVNYLLDVGNHLNSLNRQLPPAEINSENEQSNYEVLSRLWFVMPGRLKRNKDSGMFV
ncbi:hypothetical protein pdam_00001545 [Pocillopora damicornis]|uniref:Uncharacterized protein n=1 Tax=Pocillopora damicornis TaxID=46731 RepID=A0A3M6U538_POCDA|nr:hypothetical protein pdam_00001545 [Pocillopora damicornis]